MLEARQVLELEINRQCESSLYGYDIHLVVENLDGELGMSSEEWLELYDNLPL